MPARPGSTAGRDEELPDVSAVEVTIEDGESASAVVDLSGGRLRGIVFPTGWPVDVAVKVQMRVDADGTWLEVVDNSGPMVIEGLADQYRPLTVDDYLSHTEALRYVRLVSVEFDTDEWAAAAVTGDKVLTLLLR